MGNENNNTLTKLIAKRRSELPDRWAEYAAKHISEISPNDLKEGMSLETLVDFEDFKPNLELVAKVNSDSVGEDLVSRVMKTLIEYGKKIGNPLPAFASSVTLVAIYVDYAIIIMDGEAIRKEIAEKMQNIMRGTK